MQLSTSQFRTMPRRAKAQALDVGSVTLGPGLWSNATVSISKAGVLACTDPNLVCAGATNVVEYTVQGSGQETVYIDVPSVTLSNQSDPSQSVTHSCAGCHGIRRAQELGPEGHELFHRQLDHSELEHSAGHLCRHLRRNGGLLKVPMGSSMISTARAGIA